jgi:hypothetical protein
MPCHNHLTSAALIVVNTGCNIGDAATNIPIINGDLRLAKAAEQGMAALCEGDIVGKMRATADGWGAHHVS